MNKKQKMFAQYLLSLLFGASITLGFSPFHLWPVILLAIAMAFSITRNLAPCQAFISGFLFGVGMFGSGISWVYVSIHHFGAASLPLAGVLTTLFIAVLSLLFIAPCFWAYSQLHHRFKINHPCYQAILFSALWVIFEWSRSWVLTGFPWLLTGYSLIDTPAASWAPITGVYGLSLLVVITGSMTAAFMIKSQKKLITGIALSAIAILWLLSWPLSHVSWTAPTGKKITFSAIQGNIPQSLKWDPNYIRKILSTYQEQTQSEWQQDLIIWPENAIPVLYTQIKGWLDQISKEAQSHNTALITGLPIDDPSSKTLKYYNGVIAMGEGSGMYYKQKLVPFGEYVPFQSLLRGLIAFFNLPMSSFSAGSPHQAPFIIKGIKVTPYICYEIVYPDFVAKMARNAGLLITISNDSWFGQSIGPQQHFQMARMRALETGRYLVRATNDGITALINEHGKVLSTIPRFHIGILRGTAMIMTGNTPFMITGSWPLLFLSLILIIMCAFCCRSSTHNTSDTDNTGRAFRLPG